MADPDARLLTDAWQALVAGDPAGAVPAPRVATTGAGGALPSAFAVEGAIVACIATALRAASALQRQRTGTDDGVVVDRRHAAAAATSERHFVGPGSSHGAGFAPLSRFWAASDGWVRTHANYPWHRSALLGVLGCSDHLENVGAAIGERRALEVEEAVFASGGVAGAVRTLRQWRDHPQGRAVGSEALIGWEVAGDSGARRRSPGALPASGLRVLDLTRVIAGPVCTRYLASLGADVVRLDPPEHPDLTPGTPADTLLGKKSALVDLARAESRAAVRTLLGEADVVVCGYRPGSLDRFGLHPAALAQDHPGLVVVVLSAWGHSGPWAERRGFDSVVQAPSGIAWGEGQREAAPGNGAAPGALPCQLLDHGTGYLAAAAALDGIRRQEQHGGTHVRRLSLARTAAWLTSAPGAEPDRDPVALDPGPWLVEVPGRQGAVTAVAPPGRLGDRPLSWPSPATGYGDDAPAWPAAPAAP